MAAMLASRRAAPMAKLLEKLLVNPTRALEASSQSAVRSFNTNAQMRGADEEERGPPECYGKEDDDAFHLRIKVPGLSKEHVKVSVEQNTLIIRGEGEKESEEEEAGRSYSGMIDLPQGLCKRDQIRAQMKNGLLKVTVPKVTEEERKDVFQVQIE